MATQDQSSNNSSVVLTVTVEGTQLDIRTASREQPDALRTALIRAFGLITLSPSDLVLLQLQEKFRISLERARLKTPDRLAAVVYSCNRGSIQETLWEAQVWRHGGKHLVDAVHSAISRVSPDDKQFSDTVALHLLEVGEQPAVTAFHLMNCPASLEDFRKVKDKFFAYGGTFALAACAVAIADDIQVMASLENLSPDHRRELVTHLFCMRLHTHFIGMVQSAFTSKEPRRTKRCRIGPAPREPRNQDGEGADTTIEDERPRKRRARTRSTQHTTNMACQRVPAQASATARCENPNEPAAVGDTSPSYSGGAGGTDNFQTSGKRTDSTGSCSSDDMLLDSNSDLFENYGIELDYIDFSTPSL